MKKTFIILNLLIYSFHANAKNPSIMESLSSDCKYRSEQFIASMDKIKPRYAHAYINDWLMNVTFELQDAAEREGQDPVAAVTPEILSKKYCAQIKSVKSHEFEIYFLDKQFKEAGMKKSEVDRELFKAKYLLDSPML
ncbi:hypothetical protein ACLSU7_00660 [Bdellovibrio sp. HCB185ZH]|uniref:hypothetical protein n=1 Tax=Bdellovibrio sp. HCB185ZH TaxID=3394235 RepID=UPI0039A6B50C